MPSFDTVCETDPHEIGNAVDQTRRELATRFDFKGSKASVEQKEAEITLQAESDFQLGQLRDILYSKLAKRNVDIQALEAGKVDVNLGGARQVLTVRQGIDTDTARKIVKLIKEAKLKVQAAIQGDKVRVTGKKRDDLQQVIALLRGADLDIPLTFNNFRD